MEDPLGVHYIIELYECPSHTLDDEPGIKSALLEAARLAGATIISDHFHRFSPQGVSGVVVIAESHLSIHTWPENGYAALDLFTCSSELDMDRVFDLLQSTFQPGSIQVHNIRRGYLNPRDRVHSDITRLDRVPVS